MHITAAIKIICQNNFHSGEIKDYRNKNCILKKFNQVMMAIKSLKPVMRKYRTLNKRITNDESRPESLIAIQMRKDATTTRDIHDAIPQDQE